MIRAEKPPARTAEITELFAGKVFQVPDYQRTFSWERDNWEDFWNDIREGLSTQTPHYWGTITLRNTHKQLYDEASANNFTRYEVVDGQQRLTTICLFFLALVRAGKSVLRDKYVKCGDFYLMELGSLNKEFLQHLIDGREPSLQFKTNRLLKEALDYLENQVRAYVNGGGDLDDLARYIQASTMALEFQVEDESLAIKAFQSLNDRGKDLTLLDKAKSFLMFYSLRYLENELSYEIKESFGDIFKNYDFIEEAGKRAGIEYITNPRYRFSEDELLRFFYHYFGRYAPQQYALRETGYDYTLSTEAIFKEFLKGSCNLLRSDPDRLASFMDDFLEGFDNFVDSFRELAELAEDRTLARKLLAFLGLNATVYPLILSLASEHLLDDQLLRLIETLDLRVYKVRGTNPRADLYRGTISRIMMDPDPLQVHEGIRDFIEQFMRDAEFRTYLSGSIYGNAAVKYILWEFQKEQHSTFDEWNYALYDDVQVEHIFAEEPTLAFPAYGFNDEGSYLASIHKLGNLTLLEEKINKTVGNRSPDQKVEQYQTSSIPGTKDLGFGIGQSGFTRDTIRQRTKQIMDFCLERWRLY
jgi:hypothetical protein